MRGKRRTGLAAKAANDVDRTFRKTDLFAQIREDVTGQWIEFG